MKSPEQIDEYLAASGGGAVGGGRPRACSSATPRLHGPPSYCQHGCRASASPPARPAVPIAEVLRTRMYDVDYGDPELARREYAELGQGASPCLSCAHPTCASACPNGIPIPDFTRDAARRLG